jgi:flagellar motor switch protein FliG
MKKILILLFAGLIVGLTLTYAATLMEEKLSIEKTIQEHCERIIEKIIGSRDMVVIVNAELEQAEADNQAAGKPYIGAGLTQTEILPGITEGYYEASGSTSKGLRIKKIGILITLDQGISDDTVSRINNELTKLLGLVPGRGDEINLQRIAFAKPKFTLKDSLSSYGLNIYWIVTLILITIFLFGPMRGFIQTIVKSLELKIDADTRIRSSDSTGLLPNSPGGNFEAGTALESRKTKSSGNGKDEGKRFSFINDENIKNLVTLIKKETPEKVAVILNYLPTEQATKILSFLPHMLQSAVAVNLSQPKLLDSAEVQNIENDLKTKIEYFSGGEDQIIELLDNSDRNTQETILAALEKESAALALRIRKNLFFFDDLALLDKNTIQKILRASQRRGISLALALKNAPENVRKAVTDSLTEGAQSMLTEQIDLLGQVQEKRIVEEQRLISKMVREMDKAGEIVIDRTPKTANENKVNQ